VGRARSTVANTLRLLELAPSVQAAVGERRISEGHARALGGLSIDHQDHVVGTVIEQDLSVRQTEELVRRLREPRAVRAEAVPPNKGNDPDLERVEEDLRRALGTKVSLARSRRGGRIVIEYYSDEELGRLYDRLTGGNA
jgi:ParB family chromosome partitioning protein